MLRTSAASAPALAFFAILAPLALGPVACAHGTGDAFLQDDGIGGGASSTSGCDSGSHGVVTVTSTTGGGTGGARGVGGAGGAGEVSSSSGVLQGSTGALTTGSFSSSSGGGTCDASGDCQTCGDCAIAGACAPEMNACNVDQDCVALLDCLSTCQDQTCANDCASQYPGGQQAYMAMVTCVLCQACPVSCGGQAQGACGP
jgi:hypothetical protein